MAPHTGIPLIDSSRIGESSQEYYYYPHKTKSDYDQAFNNARLWALENDEETALTAARLYHVKEQSLHKSVYRSKTRRRNNQGVYNQHGGNNKILNDTQEEAIRQYCYDQWELGLGATHKMVLSAITHLRAVCSNS
jgi:hypothetical protein